MLILMNKKETEVAEALHFETIMDKLDFSFRSCTKLRKSFYPLQANLKMRLHQDIYYPFAWVLVNPIAKQMAMNYRKEMEKLYDYL